MRVMSGMQTMKTKRFGSKLLTAAFALALIAPWTASSSLAAGPMLFDTPQKAAQALVDAAAAYNVPQLTAIFGPDGKDFIETADPVRDKANAAAFAADAQTKLTIAISPSNPNRATIVVGASQWPMPVPLNKSGGKWSFDASAGRQEILYRRIGTNELDAIQVARGYVSAQEEYASVIHDNSGLNQYAQRVFSTPGKQNGLYWQNADGTSGGPIGDEVAKALNEGYKAGKNGYHGYYFKILKGQGPAAPFGKLNYVVGGAMIGGFALVAVPAQYGVTGVKTFIVNYSGIVYQKDLGPDSLNIVKKMELYNPDSTWQRTNDEWPPSVAG